VHILHLLHQTDKMIQELTKENLQKVGFKKDDVNELYSTIDTFTLQCNDGNIFVSKPENKFYTGIDFYRVTYFKNVRFPYKCPDLVNEYFDLALIEFLAKQKTVLGLLFNEKDQFNKFISNEIERSQQRIDSQKEFLLKMKHHKFESKENDIQICESYINYLEAKKSTKPNAFNPDEFLKNPYKTIFKDDFAFALFDKMKGLYSDTNTPQADYSFLFDIMQKEGFVICTGIKFIDFLKVFDICITKIDSSKTGNKRKTKLYNATIENLQKKHGLSTV
jgi:hypothetical protein